MESAIPTDAYALIIGAGKCGTSSLYSYLAEHPEICAAVVKEPEFFSRNTRHGIHVEEYSELWSFNASIHKYALEASTNYSNYPVQTDVPRRIFEHNIQPKFIYVVRNPFERIESQHNFLSQHEWWKTDIVDAQPINMSKYFLQLEQFRKFFPSKDFLVLDFERLIKDPESVLQMVYSFLGLQSSYFPREYRSINKTYIQSSTEKLIGRNLGALLPYVPVPMKKAGRKLIRKVLPKPKKRLLTDEERDFVFHELRSDMKKLSEDYGVDVGKWGF